MKICYIPVRRFSRYGSILAFTLLELMAVLAIVGVLTALSLAGLSRAKEVSRSTVCRGNLSQLLVAWSLYSDDSQGHLVGNLGDARVRFLENSNATWVLGWIDVDGGGELQANTNTSLLKLSPLASYLGGSIVPFHCPRDSSVTCPRVRSISMNGYVGALARSFSQGYRVFDSQADLSRMKGGASSLLVFLDERPDSINDGSFYTAMEGDGITPGVPRIIDYPSALHGGAGNLSFADGHVKSHRWLDPDTVPPIVPCDRLPYRGLMPGNLDIRFLQSLVTTP